MEILSLFFCILLIKMFCCVSSLFNVRNDALSISIYNFLFLFQSPKVPWVSIAKSLPFWAILMAHMGQNYGYETLMTELPSFMKQVLHFNLKDVSSIGIQSCGLSDTAVT